MGSACQAPGSLTGLKLDRSSGGPVIDQFARCSDPAYFAAGNLLRPIETAGWSYREGRRVAELLARDLRGELPVPGGSVAIVVHGPLKLCVPQRLATSTTRGLKHLQLRVSQAAQGRLRVLADGKEIWARSLTSLPERRVLIPIAHLKWPAGVQHLDVDVVDHD